MLFFNIWAMWYFKVVAMIGKYHTNPDLGNVFVYGRNIHMLGTVGIPGLPD